MGTWGMCQYGKCRRGAVGPVIPADLNSEPFCSECAREWWAEFGHRVDWAGCDAYGCYVVTYAGSEFYGPTVLAAWDAATSAHYAAMGA